MVFGASEKGVVLKIQSNPRPAFPQSGVLSIQLLMIARRNSPAKNDPGVYSDE
jgi:hypothetical protein